MSDFLLFLLVGGLAQLVDGALGMAYGLISSTMLLSFGVSPAHASASVHAAEVFTTAASGMAHLANRNIDWKLFWGLVPFGMAGGVIGATVLTSIDGSVARPYVAAYLSIMGIYLVIRSFRRTPRGPIQGALVPPIAAVGGFLDSVGGGGWGPIVTSGLLGAGGQPRYVIGSVNAAEFLVSLTVSLTFILALLTGHWEEAEGLLGNGLAVLGLIIGGVIAAPLAGHVVRVLPQQVLLRIVGGLICILAAQQVWSVFG